MEVNFKENLRNAILIVLGTSLIYALIRHFVKQDEMQCDAVVFLEGELSIDVREVTFYDSNTSTIHLCDGEILRMPTKRIIKIVDKDVQ